MKKLLLSLSLTSVLAGFVTACTTPSEPADAYRGETQHQIYLRGKEALQDKSYAEAVKRFEALEIQYPFGQDTENAQLFLIYAYYQKEDYALASSAADHFIRTYPTNPHVDYAYYMRGLSSYYQDMGVLERIFTVDLATRDLTQIQKSYYDFSELTHRFPSSGYTPAAHQYMVYLKDVMANHELRIAEYYYDRKAYVAAADRAADLVAHFQGTTAVKQGLIVMIKSYHELGMTKLEQDTLAVLKYNYPNVQVAY